MISLFSILCLDCIRRGSVAVNHTNTATITITIACSILHQFLVASVQVCSLPQIYYFSDVAEKTTKQNSNEG